MSETIICPVCSRPFIKRRKNHVRCSANCNLIAHRARQKALRPTVPSNAELAEMLAELTLAVHQLKTQNQTTGVTQ